VQSEIAESAEQHTGQAAPAEPAPATIMDWAPGSTGKGLLLRDTSGRLELVTWRTGVLHGPSHLSAARALGLPIRDIVGFLLRIDPDGGLHFEADSPDLIAPAVASHPAFHLRRYTAWHHDEDGAAAGTP
jgi:hypothetical protein